MIRTSAQNARLHGLLGKLRIDNDTKEAMVLTHTDGRTAHSSQMMHWECACMIKHLEQLAPASSEGKYRRKLISIAHKLNWYDANGKVDVDRLNSWCIKYGYLHKPLNEHKEQELVKLITQFKQLLNG